MLNIRQRLVALYILYETYLHDKVKTTPFYSLILNLLAHIDSLHPSERHLLIDYLKSVPKIAKQTPTEYVKETEKMAGPIVCPELEPYRRAHVENMPSADGLSAVSVTPTVRDDEDRSSRPTLQPYPRLRPR